MKKKILFIAAILCLGQLYAQDTLRQFEFGSTLLTINSFDPNYNPGIGSPGFEIANGLFLRYNKKQKALRFIMNYSQDHSGYYTKDFRISIGGQTFLGKRSKRLYAFADVGYRNLFITGNYSGNNNTTNVIVSESFNGFDSYFGLGFKLKIFSNLIFSPEFGYNLTKGISNDIFTDLIKGTVERPKIGSTNLKALIKLHLTVQF